MLRLGGNTSEFTTWSPDNTTTPPPFDATGPATHQHENIPTTNTPLALKNLRAFLDATNWRLIYGLNAARGTVENAVAESVAVHQILGPRLICFQLGNEPDAWRNRYRPATFTYADYAKEWATLHNAIIAKIPGAKFGGPDPSTKSTTSQVSPPMRISTAISCFSPATTTLWVLPAAPKSTLERLLNPDPKLAANLETIMAAAKSAHLSYRMTEGNSCWDGGKPGVSDTLASALWCADMMLQLAHAGAAGVNLHGGGEGFYTPIAGASSTSLTRRPEYFGIQFAQQLTGATFLRATLMGATPRISAYAFQNKQDRSLVVINKDDKPLTISVPDRPQSKALILTGPSLDSKAEPDFHSVTISRSKHLDIPAHSATLYTF